MPGARVVIRSALGGSGPAPERVVPFRACLQCALSQSGRTLGGGQMTSGGEIEDAED